MKKTNEPEGLSFNIPCYSGPKKQCCGAGAGGAEIILESGAGAENKF